MSDCEVKTSLAQNPAHGIPPAAGGGGFSNIRWLIAGLLCLAAILNYIDRNILGQLAPTIQKDLKLDNEHYALVVDAFLTAYTLAYVFSGRVIDRLGTRWGLALFVGWWSVSNALVGFAGSLASLAGLRFMLGLGEAGCWTGSPKAVGEWFPERERGLAVGFYSMGGSVGATIAPLLVNGIALRYGWRMAFVITGALGLLWLAPWLLLYRRPAQHPLISARERATLAEVIAATEAADRAPREPEGRLWLEIMRQPVVWMLMLGRLLTDTVWYFFNFWMPKYLHDARGLSQADLSIMWVIFLAADVGFVGGGFVSGVLIKRGRTAPAGRLWAMLGSACLVPLLPLVGLAPTTGLAVAVAMAVVFAATAWLSNLTSLVVDLMPKRTLGTAFGLIAGGSALGGIFMNQMVSWMIKEHSYQPCFYIMMCVHPLALALLWRLRKMRAAE